jgi:hypothetical protein
VSLERKTEGRDRITFARPIWGRIGCLTRGKAILSGGRQFPAKVEEACGLRDFGVFGARKIKDYKDALG